MRELQSDGLGIRRRLVYGRGHVDETILSLTFVLLEILNLFLFFKLKKVAIQRRNVSNFS